MLPHLKSLVIVNILRGLILQNPTKYFPEKFNSFALYSGTIFRCGYAVRAVANTQD